MRLAEWRRRQGLTQEAFAASIGCVQSLISLVERATEPRVPSTEVIRRIYRATAGAVTPNDLVFPEGLPDLNTAELPLAVPPTPLFGDREPDCEPPESRPLEIAA